MTGSGSPRSGRSILAELKPEEAADVLRRLIENEPRLKERAERLGQELLEKVSCEDVAAEVEAALGGIDADDVSSRAGGHSWGYVEPGEAAMELVEEAVEPFREDMKRRLGRGQERQALEICKGIILGLYRVEQEGESEIVAVAPDALSEEAGWALSICCKDTKGGKARRRVSAKRAAKRIFLREWAMKFVPEWASFIVGNRD
jgi:hypothetical protein